jgi:hypothetical protein
MPSTNRSYLAGGNIYPSRFVKLDANTDAATPAGSFTVLQAADGTSNGGDPVIGISMEGTDYPPINDSHITVGGYAAIAGEPLKVYGEGEECLLEIGDTVATGDSLKPDSNGKGIPVASSGTVLQKCAAIAQQSGVSGNKILVKIVRNWFHVALA